MSLRGKNQVKDDLVDTTLMLNSVVCDKNDDGSYHVKDHLFHSDPYEEYPSRFGSIKSKMDSRRVLSRSEFSPSIISSLQEVLLSPADGRRGRHTQSMIFI